MTVCAIGLGRVGLPTARLLAQHHDGGDTRETPVLSIPSLQRNVGRTIRTHDPFVDPDGFPIDPEPLDDAVTDADCLLVAADHSAFRDPIPGRLADRIRARTVVDTRSILDRRTRESAGIRGDRPRRRPGRTRAPT